MGNCGFQVSTFLLPTASLNPASPRQRVSRLSAHWRAETKVCPKIAGLKKRADIGIAHVYRAVARTSWHWPRPMARLWVVIACRGLATISMATAHSFASSRHGGIQYRWTDTAKCWARSPPSGQLIRSRIGRTCGRFISQGKACCSNVI